MWDGEGEWERVVLLLLLLLNDDNKPSGGNNTHKSTPGNGHEEFSVIASREEPFARRGRKKRGIICETGPQEERNRIVGTGSLAEVLISWWGASRPSGNVSILESQQISFPSNGASRPLARLASMSRTCAIPYVVGRQDA